MSSVVDAEAEVKKVLDEETFGAFDRDRDLPPEAVQMQVELVEPGDVVEVRGLGGTLLIQHHVRQRTYRAGRDHQHRRGDARDRLGPAGEPDEVRVDPGEVGGEHVRGVPLGVHRDEQNLQPLALVTQQTLDLGHGCHGCRADIRTLRIAKVE